MTTQVPRHGEIMVTLNVLTEFKDELKSLFRSELSGIRAEIHSMRSHMEKMQADIHGVKLMVQIQHQENIVALDAIRNVTEEWNEFRTDHVNSADSETIYVEQIRMPPLS